LLTDGAISNSTIPNLYCAVSAFDVIASIQGLKNNSLSGINGIAMQFLKRIVCSDIFVN
jgi:hypothetical protein